MGANKRKRSKDRFLEQGKKILIDDHIEKLMEPLREQDRIAEDQEFAGLLIDGIVVCQNQ